MPWLMPLLPPSSAMKAYMTKRARELCIMLSCQQEGSTLLCNDDHMGSHGCPHARSHICVGLNRPGSAEAKNLAAMTLFVVTGYSHFPGCPENPTESLVNRLKEELSKSTQHCVFVY